MQSTQPLGKFPVPTSMKVSKEECLLLTRLGFALWSLSILEKRVPKIFRLKDFEELLWYCNWEVDVCSLSRIGWDNIEIWKQTPTKGLCSWTVYLTVAKKQMPGEKCKNRASIFSQNSLPGSNTLCRRHFLSQRLSVIFNSCTKTSPPWTCPFFSWTDVNIWHPQHPMARVQGLNTWQA